MSSSKPIKNVLVTGGAGFIGTHVVNALLARGYQVRVLDNLSPPAHDGRLPEWFSEKAEFVKGDVREKKDWRKALAGIDAVIHLAAYADYHLDFSNYIRSNIESIALLFELILEEKLPIKKIVSASSQSVYGEGKYKCLEHGEIYVSPRPEEQLAKHQWEQICPQCGRELAPAPQKEDDILKPQIPYGISKLASEHLLLNLGKRYGVPSALTRVSIAVGSHQSFRHYYSGALRAFAVYVLAGEPIKINEDGQQSRDFINVHDVAQAYLKILEEEKADYEIFNIGCGESAKVIDLARAVAKEAGVEFDLSLANRFRLGDARHQLMDNSKLKSLGWRPEHTLQEAVRDYLRWVRQFGDLKKYLEETRQKMQAEGVLK